MIDYFNEIVDTIAEAVWSVHGEGVAVKAEHVDTPSTFPCVTIDEMSNVPSHLDSGSQKLADVTYRIQVFTKGDKKRANARKIFGTVADAMYDMNLIGKTTTTTPAIYNLEIFEIQGTFEGTIKKDGTIFRR